MRITLQNYGRSIVTVKNPFDIIITFEANSKENSLKFYPYRLKIVRLKRQKK